MRQKDKTAPKSKRQDLTKGDLKKQILYMTLPMIIGMLGMVIFNFVDALYIGILGETELAAIAFTFPVVMVVSAVSQGLAMGTGTVVSAYMGQKNEDGIKKTTANALILSFIIVVFFSLLGSLTIKPLFTAMGATANEMVHIKTYMRIWYFGMPFVVFPMVGNNIIRALGDTKVPSYVMAVAFGMNAILDPILIFDWGFGMGIAGAALATVFSRFFTFCAAVYVLTKREHVLTFKGLNIREFKSTCRKVLYIAVPTTVTRAVLPIGTGVITALVASFGIAEVAGYGAGVKIEQLSFSVIQALSTVMVAVTGQNFGAKQFARIKQGFNTASAYALLYSLIAIPLFYFAAPLLSLLFDVSAAVRDVIVVYVRIAVFGVGFFGILNVASSLLNAIKKPVIAALLFLIEMFGIYIPAAYYLSGRFGVVGVFYALIIAYVLSGILTYGVTKKVMNKTLREPIAQG